MADAANTQSLPTDSRSGVIVGVVSFLLPLTTIVVGLRFYTRRNLSNGISADDWVTLLSLILTYVVGIVMCVMTTKGLGHHVWTIPKDHLKDYYETFYLSIVFYDAGLGAVKLAILLQYLRVFSIKMRKVTLWVIALTTIWSVALVLRSAFSCTPIQGFWDKSIPSKCLPNLPRWYIDAAGNILSDVIILALPIPVLWTLQLPRPQRLSLIGIFCLGFFTCAISVIRVTFLKLSPDDTYDNTAAAGWSIGELCCGIVCASLGTLRPLLARLIPAPLRLYRSTAGAYAASGSRSKNKHPHYRLEEVSGSSKQGGGKRASVGLASASAGGRRSRHVSMRHAPADLGKDSWLAAASRSDDSDEDLALDTDLERRGGGGGDSNTTGAGAGVFLSPSEKELLAATPTGETFNSFVAATDEGRAAAWAAATVETALAMPQKLPRAALRRWGSHEGGAFLGGRAEGEPAGAGFPPCPHDPAGLRRVGTFTTIEGGRRASATPAHGRSASETGFGIQVRRELKIASASPTRASRG